MVWMWLLDLLLSPTDPVAGTVTPDEHGNISPVG